MSRARMFQDDQPDARSPRTTIVGGRPPEDRSDLPPVPTGIQTLLRLAAIDDAFRQALLAQRAAVAESAGVALTRSEAAILAAVPADQLERMVAAVPPATGDRRSFLRQAAASAAILLGGATLADTLGCERAACALTAKVGGAAPDEPPPRPPEPPAPVPDTVDPPPPRPHHGFPAPGGANPDSVPPRPKPPALPEPPPPRVDVPAVQTTGGAAPDLPPPRPQRRETDTNGGAAPDPAPPRPRPEPDGRPERTAPPTAGVRPDTPPPKP